MSDKDDLAHAPGVPLGSYLDGGSYYLGLECLRCRRLVNVTFAAAVARFGRAMGTRDLARRLKCTGCGKRGMDMRLEASGEPAYRDKYGGDAPLDHWPHPDEVGRRDMGGGR